MLTRQETEDRLADALRDVQMVVDPDGTVRIFCEDKLNTEPGKKYIFMMVFPITQFQLFFEAGGAPLIPPGGYDV